MIISMSLEPISYKYKVESLLKTFYPLVRFSYDKMYNDKFKLETTKNKVLIYADIDGKKLDDHFKIEDHEEVEYIVLKRVYSLLCKIKQTKKEYGMMLGVRPVKYVLKMKKDGKSSKHVVNHLQDRWDLSSEKANLCNTIADIQLKLDRKTNVKNYHLYVSIPFCSSRCNYCSFVSQNTQNTKHLIEKYIYFLKKELKLTKEIATKNGLILKSIYIGGGTPTVLKRAQLEDVLSCIDELFNKDGGCEYTVEAGRYDSLDLFKIKLLKNYKVNRICLNPQTFTQEVLKEVGRPFNERDFNYCYNLLIKHGFENINMDFIAGLPKETTSSFLSSIKQAIDLHPSNITVHALTVKRGSNYYRNLELKSKDCLLMIKKSSELIKNAGYIPYYMYRQKNMLSDAENIGYALKNNVSYYNIAIMEEDETILSCGAGSVTKLVDKTSISRVFNYKFPLEYLNNFSGIIDKKSKAIKFYESV